MSKFVYFKLLDFFNYCTLLARQCVRILILKSTSLSLWRNWRYLFVCGRFPYIDFSLTVLFGSVSFDTVKIDSNSSILLISIISMSMMSGAVVHPGSSKQARASSVRGSAVSYHAVSYYVDVPVPGTRCVRERKQILKSVR